MKDLSLLEQYEFSLKMLSIVMPILAVIMVIIGIILSIALQKVFWVGLIIVAIGLGVFVLFVLIRKFLIWKINGLKNL
ncbi:MAG: hypothetical protein RR248_05370 [Clostridia bacterium]